MTDTLTIDTLIEAAQRLSPTTPVLVGIACSSSGYARLKDLYRGPPRSAICPSLDVVPLYLKTAQRESFRLFYDHDELRAYLKEIL